MALFVNQSDNCSVFSWTTQRTDPLYYRLSLTVFPVLMTLFTIVGNGFVIIAIRANKRLARKRTSILILNLALADLLVGGGVMPFGISQIINENHWLFGRTLCRVWTALDVICCTASIFTLCIISVDRFIGVTIPLGYSYIVTRGRLWTAVLGVWVLSIAVLLTTMQWKETKCSNVFVCRVGDEIQYVVHSVIMSFFIPLTVILIVHYKIYQVTRRRELSLLHNSPLDFGKTNDSSSLLQSTVHQKRYFSLSNYYNRKVSSPATALAGTATANNRRHTTTDECDCAVDETIQIARNLLENRDDDERRRSSASTNSERQKFLFGARGRAATLRVHYGGNDDDVIKQRKFYTKHKKTAKTLALVVGAFLFCWLPFFILYVISSTCANECVPAAVMEAFTWLGYSNSAFNPIIYAVSMRTFGGGMRQTLARISCLFSYQWPCFRNGSVSPGHRRQSRSPSTAPNTAVVTECSILPDGVPTTLPCGGRSSFSLITKESFLITSGAHRASLWMRQRASTIGASLKKSKKPTEPVVNEKGENSSKSESDAEGEMGNSVQTLNRFDSPKLSTLDDEQKQLEDELLYYVHNFSSNCEDDLEIENSIGAAILRRETSTDTVIFVGGWPTMAE